jgi:hypothetical protein
LHFRTRTRQLDGELVVCFDLLGELSDITELDTELIVARATLLVLRAQLLISERFELCENFLERECNCFCYRS